jgi:diguanylate cyclase (GGDEF)-like protein/PAS domain S-box-containing protein
MNKFKFINIFTRQISLGYYVLVFVVLQLLLIGLLSYGKQHVVHNYQAQLAEELGNDFNFSRLHYREIADLNFQTRINQPEVLALLEQAGSASEPERELLRQELFGQFEPMFRVMEKTFRQVHFHLADGTSFLRLHDPAAYGDNLYVARESIQLLDREKQVLDGFEMGRNFYAIRYLYPLFNRDNRFIGSVEMGISFQQFRASLFQLAKGEHFLLIRSEIAGKKLVSGVRDNFQTSSLSEQFVMEKIDVVEPEVLGDLHHEGHISSQVLAAINNKIRPAIHPYLLENSPFSIMTRVARQGYGVSFIPLHNIIGYEVGYLVRYGKDLTLIHLQRDYFLAYIIGAFLILFLLLLYRWATDKIFRQLNFQQNVLDSIPTPVFYTNGDGNYMGSNKSFVKSFGLPGSIGQEGEETTRSGWQEISQECIRGMEVAEGIGAAEQEITFSEEGGGDRIFYCYKARFENTRDRGVGLVGTLFDISKSKAAEKALASSHAEIQQIFNTAADGMRVVDNDHNVLLVNERFASMCGVAAEDLQGSKCYDVFGGSSCMTSSCPLTQILAGEEWVESELIKKMPDGREIPCIVTATPYRDGDGVLVGIIEDFKDISDRKDLERRLEMLSRTDELTGLLNRRGFISDAEQMLSLSRRQNKNLFLVFADMDNMKEINDRFGHDKGDYALRTLAELLGKGCRESDIICRLGGDEFAILLVDVVSGEEERIVSRFQDTLSLWNMSATEGFELALSMGIVKARADISEGIEDLLKRADLAMYRVKKERKSQEK